MKYATGLLYYRKRPALCKSILSKKIFLFSIKRLFLLPSQDQSLKGRNIHMRYNNDKDLLQLNFTLKISIFLEVCI